MTPAWSIPSIKLSTFPSAIFSPTCCSPPRLSTTQLPSATDRPVFLSDRDFHPTVGASSQAHSGRAFGVKDKDHRFVNLALMGARPYRCSPNSAFCNSIKLSTAKSLPAAANASAENEVARPTVGQPAALAERTPFIESSTTTQ